MNMSIVNEHEQIMTDGVAPPTLPPQPPPPQQQQRDDDNYTAFEKKLKWVKSIKKKFKRYIKQISVVGFNSGKYDINLIRPFLPASLIKFGKRPEMVIKKGNGYMAISTNKLKFVDIGNYLAAGTSLKQFYAAYNVSTAKETFPYQWFDSLAKLDHPGLPNDKGVFKSILTNKGISDDEFQDAKNMFISKGFTTFRDWVRYYNNADVIGFSEALQKMLKFEREQNKLDMLKCSISLPGLTQRYLFQRLAKMGKDYFVTFAECHKHILKHLLDSIIGGPSIIFHRYHERLVTWIRGKYPCKKIVGYDANSLYLYCLGKKMCTGFYSVLDKCNGYRRSTPYSHQSINWLECLKAANPDLNILHGENRMEVRVGNFLVDGYDPDTQTVYEFYGCYWHGHSCTKNHDSVKWQQVLDREAELRDHHGVTNIVSITSCEWESKPEAKKQYRDPINTPTMTQEKILSDIMDDRIFGLVTVDIHVPEDAIPRFSEFPPIFKNTEIGLDDIGENMQEFCRSVGRKNGVKRSLISSMWAKNHTILTPLLQKYVDLGLVVTNIERVIEYQGKEVFRWFVDEVSDDRRRADLGGSDFEMRGAASKLKGNCAYGRTLMNKYKQTKICFTEEKNVPKHVNDSFLKDLHELEGGVYEVEKQPRKIVHDLPIQIGLGVYSYAKLRMIEFWEFINTHLDKDKYQLMEMDTDSLYIAFAEDTIDECVLPEKKSEWMKRKWDFFSSEDEVKKVDFAGESISFAQWDKRTPGKFKAEFVGNGMICISSKLYTAWSDKETKFGCKGVQQKRNDLKVDNFLAVLKTQKPYNVQNAGFIKHGDVIRTYTQEKIGMGYFYGKRKVGADSYSTTHLDI